MQERKLLKRSPVQRKITNLFVVDEPADGSGSKIDRVRVGHDFDLVRHLSDIQFDIDDRVLTDR